MLTSKQRAKLRSLSNSLETILHIGKGGVTENVIRQADEALTARELVKGRVLENSLVSPREASTVLCEALGCDPVQVIGTKFVLYRENPEDRKVVIDE